MRRKRGAGFRYEGRSASCSIGCSRYCGSSRTRLPSRFRGTAYARADRLRTLPEASQLRRFRGTAYARADPGIIDEMRSWPVVALLCGCGDASPTDQQASPTRVVAMPDAATKKPAEPRPLVIKW